MGIHLTGVRVAPAAEPRSGSWLTEPSRDDACSGVIEVRAKVVVNATGARADSCTPRRRGLDDLVRPAKGLHLTVPRSKSPCDLAMVLPVAEDDRSITVTPWNEHTYIGTTDTDNSGPFDDPRVQPSDIT